MDIIANPMLVATVVMVVLCLLKVEVFFSIVASVFVCIFLSGANVNDSFWLFINGMGGNNEIVYGLLVMGMLGVVMQEIKMDSTFDPTIYMGQAEIADEVYQEIVYHYQSYVREMQQLLANTVEEERDHLRKTAAVVLREKLRCVCLDSRVVMAALVKYLYIDNPHGKKTLLWEAYGKDMVEALSEARLRCLTVPMPSDEAGFDYLGKQYEMREVGLDA